MTNTEHLNRIYEAMMELQDVLKKDKAEELSQLEIDLSRDKLKQMYDVLLKLKAAPVINEKIDSAKEKPFVKEQTPETSFVLDIDESIHEMESPLHEIETDEILTSDPEPETEIEPEIFQAPEVEQQEEVIMETAPEEEFVSEVEKETLEEIKAGDVLDLFNEPQIPDEKKAPAEIDEKLNEKETVADRLRKDKLESIKSAIGINEKFFFLNELFGGDLQAYNDNIKKLDAQISQEDAFDFLKELSELYGWEKESEAVEQITTMLNNKFS